VWLHIAGYQTDLYPVAILRTQEASGAISFATVIFEELSFYKVNPERVSGNAILGFENT
jgi:hypothetical protein